MTLIELIKLDTRQRWAYHAARAAGRAFQRDTAWRYAFYAADRAFYACTPNAPAVYPVQ